MNTIVASKSGSYRHPYNITWANRPMDMTYVSTTNIGADMGWQALDITNYIQDINAGLNNTLELKAADESSAYLANVFYSGSGQGVRRMSLTYRDAWDVRLDLDINEMDQEMRVYTPRDTTFNGLSFDGIARPNSTVLFELIEKESGAHKGSVNAKDRANRYFIDPIFITNPIADVQTYIKGEVNYTTDYIKEDSVPRFDTVYEYAMKVQHDALQSSKDVRSDAIVKYKVKLGDTLASIAAYYGVPIATIKFDNNRSNDRIKEDKILLVRMKKDNPKVSKDVYTPPTKVQEYKAKYVDRGSNCVAGVCPMIDPVNSNTGNYYYEGVDFSVSEGTPFEFKRYYNSTDPIVTDM